MTSNNTIKKHQSEVNDRIIDLKRFAYDVISYSALKFGVLENCIQEWKGEKNDYGCSDFILVLSRIFLKYQITERNLLCRSFKSRYNLNKFQSFEDICTILRQVFNLFIRKARGCVLHEVVISLSVINEMILFLYSENCSLHLEELSRFWCEYLSPIKHNFEKAGGFSKLYKMYNMPKYDIVDIFYNSFIPAICIPYNRPDAILGCLDSLFHEESYCYFRDLLKDLPLDKMSEYADVMLRTLWRHSAVESKERVVKNERIRINAALETVKLNETSSALDIPENTGLGIPQHQELLCACGVQEDAGKTSLNLPGLSCQKEPSRHRRLSGQEKRNKLKSCSGSSVEKDLKKLNLDSSESKDSTLKKK